MLIQQSSTDELSVLHVSLCTKFTSDVDSGLQTDKLSVFHISLCTYFTSDVDIGLQSFSGYMRYSKSLHQILYCDDCVNLSQKPKYIICNGNALVRIKDIRNFQS